MEKYLQLLLKEVNTVIIPGLGTLTITNQSTGETMFMSYLKYDDGKLSAYISQKEGCTEEEAKAMISKSVQSILDTVEANKSFSIGDLGSFSKDKNGEIQFVDGEVGENIPFENDLIEQSNEVTAENKSELVDISTPEATIIDVPVTEIPVIPLPKKKGLFGMFGKKEKVVEEKPTSVETTPSIVNSETIVDQSSEEQVLDIKEKTDAQIETPVVNEQITDELSNDVEEEYLPGNEVSDMVEVIVTEEISIEVSSDEETGIVTEDIHIHEEVRFIPVEEPKIESTPSQVSVAEEPVIEKDNTNSESDVNIELEESAIVFQKTKKKRGVVFWVLMSLIVIVIAGGTFIGLNFDKYKQYIPFMAENTKILKSDEDTAIKEFESNKTEPTTEETAAPVEEMIETTEEATPVENTTPVEEVAPVEPKKKSVKSSSPRPTSSTTGAPASSGGEFHIVLATFTEKTNADSYVVKLVAQGTSSAAVIERDGKFSVCYGSYASKSDAESNLSSAKAVSANAWLLHKSN